MNLLTFNPETLPQARMTSPTVGIGVKSGVVTFGKTAMELMKLKPGDCVAFLQDADEMENWYLEKAETGFELREYKNMVCFSNCSLARRVVPDATEGTFKFLIAGQPTKLGKRVLWGLIRLRKA